MYQFEWGVVIVFAAVFWWICRTNKSILKFWLKQLLVISVLVALVCPAHGWYYSSVLWLHSARCRRWNHVQEIIAYSKRERPKGMDEKRQRRYEERVMERVKQELGHLENEAPIPWYWLPEEWRGLGDQ